MAEGGRDNFFRDSVFLLVGNLAVTLLNFFFQVYMGRALGPVAYGMLGVVFAVFYLEGAVLSTITYSLAKFFSNFYARGDRSAIRTLFQRALRRFNIFGFLVFLFFLLGAQILAGFLKFPSSWPVVWLGIFLWSAFFTPVLTAFLSGLQQFLPLAVVQFFSTFVKLVVGIVAVFLGFGLNGVIVALVASSLLPFLPGLIWIGPYLKEARIKLDTRPIYRYSVPTFVATVCLAFYNNFDLILVKHFFNSIEAGFYVACGTLAKTICFGVASLLTVLFPKVVNRSELEQNSLGLLIKALKYFLFGSAVALLLFYSLPELLTRIVFGQQYQLKRLLFPMGVAMFFYSLANILTVYLLALSEEKKTFFLSLFVILEVIFIWLRHNSLLEVVQVVTWLMIFLSLILAGIVWQVEKNKNAA
jgi:O-antigen/teichoic acid export membrane protein